MVMRLRTLFREEETLERWNRRHGETCDRKEMGRAELRAQRHKSQERQTHSSKATGKSCFPSKLKSSRNKQFVFVYLWLSFCFAFVPWKGLPTYSGSGETFMSAGKTKPRLTTVVVFPSAAPNHRASTLSCFEKPQPKPKLLSQLCQVELNTIFLNLLIW